MENRTACPLKRSAIQASAISSPQAQYQKAVTGLFQHYAPCNQLQIISYKRSGYGTIQAFFLRA